MLSVFAHDLSRSIDDAARVISEDVLAPMLDGLKRRAVAAVHPTFFSLSVPADFASILLANGLLEGWLTHSFSHDVSKSEITAGSLVRELFLMLLERASAPLEIHTFPIQHGNSADSNLHGEGCSGISSPSIVNGFKTFHGTVKKGIDVSEEDYQLSDGSIISILRSNDCEHKRHRGSMCSSCKSAQNRWAVRLCRSKKTAAVSAPPPEIGSPL